MIKNQQMIDFFSGRYYDKYRSPDKFAQRREKVERIAFFQPEILYVAQISRLWKGHGSNINGAKQSSGSLPSF
jgi:hypothetical protein